jgi:transposase, IS5 family
MGRNHLAHGGDAINAVLAAAGCNFRRLLAWLSFLLLSNRARLSRPAKIDLKPSSSRTTKQVH